MVQFDGLSSRLVLLQQINILVIPIITQTVCKIMEKVGTVLGLKLDSVAEETEQRTLTRCFQQHLQ